VALVEHPLVEKEPSLVVLVVVQVTLLVALVAAPLDRVTAVVALALRLMVVVVVVVLPKAVARFTTTALLFAAVVEVTAHQLTHLGALLLTLVTTYLVLTGMQVAVWAKVKEIQPYEVDSAVVVTLTQLQTEWQTLAVVVVAVLELLVALVLS
jgi:hypothetical protein